MSDDALFQLGMGPAGLDTAQKEDTFAGRALKKSARMFRAPRRSIYSELATRIVRRLLPRRDHTGGQPQSADPLYTPGNRPTF